MDQLLEVLGRYWGYSTFRPLQREAMEAILAHRDSVVVLPTGGGKSLCFQAPALVHPGLAVVVSPLISLMKDQVDGLTANGVPAACFNSALPADERAAVLRGIRDGRYRLLYVSPERLAGDGSESFLAQLGRSSISFIAVDEAHCISQWGHDFRPEYRQLARLRDVFPGVSLHAYTATATARVRRDIAAQLALRDPTHLVGSFDRPNLIYRVLGRAKLKRQLQDVLERLRRTSMNDEPDVGAVDAHAEGDRGHHDIGMLIEKRILITGPFVVSKTGMVRPCPHAGFAQPRGQRIHFPA